MAIDMVREHWESVRAAEARLWTALRAMVEREGLVFRGAAHGEGAEVVIRIAIAEPDGRAPARTGVDPPAGAVRAEAPADAKATAAEREADPTDGLGAVTARPGDDLDALIARDPECLRVRGGNGHCGMALRLEGEALQRALCTALVQDATPTMAGLAVGPGAAEEVLVAAWGWCVVENERRELQPDPETFLRAAATRGVVLDASKLQR